MRIRHAVYVLAVLPGTVLLLGCSGNPEKTYPVEGVVTLDGTPVGGGEVMFEMIEPAGGGKRYTARGKIESDGRYRLRTFATNRNDGAVAGRYRVAVLPPEGQPVDDPSARSSGPPPFPPKYSSPEKSGLEFEVTAAKSHIDIELVSR
jgi:hypothetical protein